MTEEDEERRERVVKKLPGRTVVDLRPVGHEAGKQAQGAAGKA